jgi:hypothetical protein
VLVHVVADYGPAGDAAARPPASAVGLAAAALDDALRTG